MSQEYEHEVPGTPQLGDNVFHYNPNLNTSRLVPTAEWISSSPDNATPTVPRTPVLMHEQVSAPMLNPYCKQSRLFSNDQFSTPTTTPGSWNRKHSSLLYDHFRTPRRATEREIASNQDEQCVPRTPRGTNVPLSQGGLFLSVSVDNSPTAGYFHYFKPSSIASSWKIGQALPSNRIAYLKQNQKQVSIIKSKTTEDHTTDVGTPKKNQDNSKDTSNASQITKFGGDKDTLILLNAVADRLKETKTKGLLLPINDKESRQIRHEPECASETNGYDFLDIIEKENVSRETEL